MIVFIKRMHDNISQSGLTACVSCLMEKDERMFRVFMRNSTWAMDCSTEMSSVMQGAKVM